MPFCCLLDCHSFCLHVSSCFIQQSDDECVLDLDLITDLVLQIDAHGEPGRFCLAPLLFPFAGGWKMNPAEPRRFAEKT